MEWKWILLLIQAVALLFTNLYQSQISGDKRFLIIEPIDSLRGWTDWGLFWNLFFRMNIPIGIVTATILYFL